MGSCFDVLTAPIKIIPALPLSDEELVAFSRANESYRIERHACGEIVLMTLAGGKTGNREGYIFRELDFWAEREVTGIAFNSNTGFVFPDGEMRLPNAAWLSIKRWSKLTSNQQEGFLPHCPEFVVELRSPSDRIPPLEERMEFWKSKGAQLGWLIDPQRKLAVIYRVDKECETLIQPEFLDGEGPVAGFRLKMERFWA